MQKKLFLFAISLIFWLSAVLPFAEAQSGRRIQIYSAAELAANDGLYRSYIQAVFREDLIGQLPLSERAALMNTHLVIPRGVLQTPPIAVWAIVDERTVYFPIQTAAFLDDLAALAGWLTWQGCSFEPGALYAGMIVNKTPPANQLRYPNPRSAFGLGDNVWNDQNVKNTSNQILKTSIYFILAHELGHIKHNHSGYDTITPERAQQQELEADRFAIETMRHIGVPPVGMFYFFTVLSRMEGRVPNTHPLSGSRLIQIASALEQNPGDFVPPNESRRKWAPVIRNYAHQFRTLLPVVDNSVLREQLDRQASFAPWSELRRSCP